MLSIFRIQKKSIKKLTEIVDMVRNFVLRRSSSIDNLILIFYKSNKHSVMIISSSSLYGKSKNLNN